jgi:tetratricopeptide (TPR) repeat protein
MSPPSRTERALALAEQHVEAAQYMTVEERFAEAHAQWLKAAALYDEAAEHEGQQLAWMRAGLLSQKLDEVGRALDELTQAVGLARAPGSERSLAIALSHLATLHAQSDRPREAAEGWNEALSLAEVVGEEALVGAIANNLARLMLDRGELAEAEVAFEKARAAALKSDDQLGIASAHNALGEIARSRGQDERAKELFERAFDGAHMAQDIPLMALTLDNLGNTLRQLGDLERAEQRFQSALAFANVLGDGIAIARTHTNLGNIAAARGLLDDAQRYYTKALSLDKRNQQLQATLGNLVNLANLRSTRGDFAGAKKFYEEALAKLPTSAVRTIADLETMLGQLEARLGHLDDAEQLFTRAATRAKASGHHAASARLAMNLAALAHARGDLHSALDGYRRAVGLLDQYGSPSDRVMGHLVVADLALARNLIDLAEAAVGQAEARLEVLRGDDEGPVREALDVDAMKARLAFARHPDDEARQRMEATAEDFINAGRSADGMGQLLTLLDEDTALEARLTRIHECLTWAEKQGVEPLVLELKSLEALATRADLGALDPLMTRAADLGLKLVALRIGRRRAALLLAHGRDDDAALSLSDLIANAKALGADAECIRLMALQPR